MARNKVIIGGASEFTQDFTLADLKGIDCIGVNGFFRSFAPKIILIGDTDQPKGRTLAEEAAKKKADLYLSNPFQDKDINKLADFTFTRTNGLSKTIDGGLLWATTSAVPAVQLACILKYTDILLFGVDFTPGHNSKLTSNFILSTTEIKINTDLLQKIANFYNVNLYQANPNANTPGIEHLSLKDFKVLK